MDVTATEQTPVLVVRVWFEEPGGAGFRARVVRELPGGEAATDAVARVDDVLAVVRDWLDDCVARSGAPG
jgi:hypothetical protein